MKNKPNNRVFLSKMNTEIGRIPVLGNFQRINRPLMIYHADRQTQTKYLGVAHESIFFIIRHKDTEALKQKGYTITSILCPAKKYVMAFYDQKDGVKLQVSAL